ncbi:MAG: zinc ABC transporter substrate-binding protein [Deltaproteobacteria bacterium]|nr:zinc ABC transporter substrate-binding protein [Deltaproteobacteria bacterium]
MPCGVPVFRLLAGSLCLLGLLAAPVLAAEAPLPVFVSILPQKYFVERIGGDQVKVAVLVGPGRSPATYEPTPKQMAELSQARLYFSVGVPFETVWMKRLAANNPRMKVVDSRRGIQLLSMTSHHHHDDEKHPAGDHHAAHDQGQGLPDPHVWTSPARVRIMAENILAALIAAAPDHQAEFRANCKKFVADLDALEREIRERLANLTNRRFLVFHPSWGYFAHDFGLDQIAIESSGKEPGAKALAALIQQAKRDNIRVIFVQRQFSRTAAATVAASINGRVVAIDPLAEDYFGNLRAVATAFATAMEKP